MSRLDALNFITTSVSSHHNKWQCRKLSEFLYSIQSRLIMSALSDWKPAIIDVSQHMQHQQIATVITVQITSMTVVY